jgi:pyrimidine-specific ribonucleoside hydrolase
MGLDRGTVDDTLTLTLIVDGGLDDALAIAVLMGSGITIDQVIATEGSVARSTTARASRRWLATLGSSAPVLLGADRGLRSAYPAGRDAFHGIDAFGGKISTLVEAEDPAERWRELGGTVLCTGALTVVAEAIRRDHRVADLVWMGGAVASGGNMTAAAEFNAWMDPLAADEVLTSGVPTRMVPLDITDRFRWGGDQIAAMADAAAASRLLAAAIATVHGRDGLFVPHDAVAAVALVDPDLFSWSSRTVRCEWAGALTTGETVVDRRGSTGDEWVRVADDVDVPQVNERIIAALSRLA